MNPFIGKPTAQILGLLTGRRKYPSKQLKPEQWLTLIWSLLKIMKPFIHYMPNFNTLESDMYAYAGPHSSCQWMEQDWRENHQEKVRLAHEAGLPDGITPKTRVIIVMRSWKTETDVLLTRDGELFALQTTPYSGGGDQKKKYASASIAPFTKKKLLALLKCENAYLYGPYLFNSLCSLVGEYKAEKERNASRAQQLYYTVMAVRDRIY
jgi:hypothetical protein